MIDRSPFCGDRQLRELLSRLFSPLTPINREFRDEEPGIFGIESQDTHTVTDTKLQSEP